MLLFTHIFFDINIDKLGASLEDMGCPILLAKRPYDLEKQLGILKYFLFLLGFASKEWHEKSYGYQI